MGGADKIATGHYARVRHNPNTGLHELLKGVDAVSIHGGKDQEERNDAIRLFKAQQKDVLVATDVAANASAAISPRSLQ